MSSKLDDFILEIDPRNNYFKRQDKIMETLNYHLSQLTKNTVENNTEFEECLWFFVENVYWDKWMISPEVEANNGMLTPKMHRKLANSLENHGLWFRKALELLEKVYVDDQSYQHIPYKMVNPAKDTMDILKDMMYLGLHGGVARVLKDLAIAMILDFAADDIKYAVSRFLDQFDYEEKEVLFYEYIRKHPELLSRGFTKNLPSSPGLILHKILEEHPRSLLRVRDIR